MIKAMFTQQTDDGRIRCGLCPHSCIIGPGQSGKCGTRLNQNNILYALNYGHVSGLSMDPIEKKPLFHYYPGKQILSVGTLGCNLHCRFCQNYHISQYYRQNNDLYINQMSPSELVSEALSQDSFAIAYTYSEPLMWYEFVQETSVLAHQKALKNVLVTNGYINPGPLKQLLPVIDAANIDLKSFTNGHYRALGGNLESVKENIITIYEKGIHLELTTLIVTEFNDHTEELESLFKWVASIDKNIPLHLSRYHPSFRATAAATDPGFMYEMVNLASEYLHFVYPGNLPELRDSLCPSCESILIHRTHHQVQTGSLIKDGDLCICKDCGQVQNFII